MTAHELNVKAAKLLRMRWGDYVLSIWQDRERIILVDQYGNACGDWSPATSIEVAMGLLFQTPDKWVWHLFNGGVQMFCIDHTIGARPITISWVCEDELPRAITEAFVAMEAAK